MIGSKGGRNGHTGGFAANPELAKTAGAKGGRISRRTSARAAEKEYLWEGDTNDELVFKKDKPLVERIRG